MKLTTMKRSRTPEKYLHHAANTMHYLMGLLSIITTFFALSIISAAKALLEQPDTLLSPSQYYGLILQAWDNGMDIAFNVGLIYFAICLAGLASSILAEQAKSTSTRHVNS